MNQEDKKKLYSEKYPYKCPNCGFPMETDTLCDECMDKDFDELNTDGQQARINHWSDQ